MTSQLRHSRWAVPGALLLSLVIAGQALAHSWSAAIPLTTSGNGFAEGLITLDSTTAVASYVEWNGSTYDVNVRRSTTSGDSWASPQTLSTNGEDSAISGLSPFVDVVWSSSGQVMYAKSIDSGVAYSLPLPLSPAGGLPLNLSVARGVNGLVVVAWQNGTTKAIKARVSTDEGVTFGTTRTVASSHSQNKGIAVAVGTGVVYVAYKSNFAKLRIKKSTNGGTTWSSAFSVSNTAYGAVDQFAMTATGTRAYLAYSVNNPNSPGEPGVRYRRTTNSGSSWSSQMNLAPPTWETWDPSISLQNGVVRAAFTRIDSPVGIYYRQSSNGTSWSTAEIVTSDGYGPRVGYAGKIVVLYETSDAIVRTGT